MKTMIKLTTLMLLSTSMFAQPTPGQVYQNTTQTVTGCSATGVNTVSGTYGNGYVTYPTTFSLAFNSNTNCAYQASYVTPMPSYTSASLSGSNLAQYGTLVNGVGSHTQMPFNAVWNTSAGYYVSSMMNAVVPGGLSPFNKDTGLYVLSYYKISPLTWVSQTVHIVLCPNAIPTPSANFSSQSSVCQGAGLTFNNTTSTGTMSSLAGTGANSYKSCRYLWSVSGNTLVSTMSATNPASASFSYTFNTPGTYTVTLVSQNWSGPNFVSSTKTATINVIATPTVSLNSPTICAGQSATLNVTGTASTYLWLPSNTPGTSTVVSPSSTTSYSVYGFTGSCMSNTAVGQVVVNVNPTVSAANGTICAGNSFTLNASGASSYTWSSGSIVSPASTSVYTVNGANGNCFAAPVQVTVVVNQLPTVTITGTNTACLNQNVTLNANGASSYTWSNGGNNSAANTVSSSVVSSSVMSVTGSDNNGCTNTASLSIQFVDCTVGIFENSSRPVFKVYPNPSAGAFNVDYIGNIEVFDGSGKMVMSRNVDGVVEIDLPTGLYIIRFDGGYSHRIIKQ